MVTAGEIIEGLEPEFTLTPQGPAVRGSAPAEPSWSMAGRGGSG